MRAGYDVKVTYNQDKATKVEAKRNINFAGFFEKFEYDSRSRKCRVYYRTDSNSSRTDYYELDNYVYINKSNRSVDARELTRNRNQYFVKGQPISFEFYRGRNDIVTGIYYDFNGNVRDGNIYGYIYNDVRRNDRTMSVSPKLYKDTYRNDAVSINIDSYTDVYASNRNRRVELTNLRRDMLVNITMKNGVATSIEILNNVGTEKIGQIRDFFGELRNINRSSYQPDNNIEIDIYEYKGYADNNILTDDYNNILVDKDTKITYNYQSYTLDTLYDRIDFVSYRYECRVKAKYTREGYLATEIVVTDKYR